MSVKKDRKLFPLICDSNKFSSELQCHFDWFSGVPDSVLKKTQDCLKNFYFSSRENHSVGMAFGASLGGSKPCLLMQNSGLGLSIDALFGLFVLYKRGLVIVLSNRGELDWEEIQHKEWGDLTVQILKSIKIDFLDFNQDGIEVVKRAHDIAYKEDKIVVILVKRGNLDE